MLARGVYQDSRGAAISEEDVMRRFLVLAVVCLAAALACRAVGAQSGTGQIRGVVTDGSSPVAGAQVKITNGGIFSGTTRSNARGAFQFIGLAAGHYDISVTMKGFEALSRPVAVTPGATEQHTFVLTPLAAKQAVNERPAMVPVTPGRAEYSVDAAAAGRVGSFSAAPYPAVLAGA